MTDDIETPAVPQPDRRRLLAASASGKAVPIPAKPPPMRVISFPVAGIFRFRHAREGGHPVSLINRFRGTDRSSTGSFLRSGGFSKRDSIS